MVQSSLSLLRYLLGTWREWLRAGRWWQDPVMGRSEPVPRVRGALVETPAHRVSDVGIL